MGLFRDGQAFSVYQDQGLDCVLGFLAGSSYLDSLIYYVEAGNETNQSRRESGTNSRRKTGPRDLVQLRWLEQSPYRPRGPSRSARRRPGNASFELQPSPHFISPFVASTAWFGQRSVAAIVKIRHASKELNQHRECTLNMAVNL